jgi:hypothetical protein
MAWARFTAEFRWPPRGPWHRTYRPGQRLSVTRDCQKAALLAGAALAIKTPPRAQVEQLKADPFWTPDASK